MQFGKVQGGALSVLGVLLLPLQVYFFHPFVTAGGNTTSRVPPGSHGPLAGVVGGVCLLAVRQSSSARVAEMNRPQNA